MNNAIGSFFTSAVLDSTSRITNIDGGYICLDKNELPFDIPDEVKSRVALALCQREWCRYPSAGGEEVEHLIGEWLDMPGDCVVAAPGAAQIIVSLLSYFALSGRPITIAQPSYSLFNYYCKTYGINYRRWMLTTQLEYDLDSFPDQSPGSVVFLSSPNNPVGNVIAVSDLEKLLSGHPQSLFVMDEVYADFAESNFLSLLGRFNNLVLLRSFSKTMSAAGVRLGYLLGSAEVCRQVRKLLLSFSLNHFTNVFATIVLQDAHLIGLFKSQVAHVIAERERLRYCFERDMGEWLRVWPSQGNFLLVTLRDSETFYHIINGLMNNGIGVLDVSGMPLLMNSFRMSVGVDYENNKVLRLLHDLVTN